MKLIRHGQPGKEQPGIILESGGMLNTSSFGEDYSSAFFDSNGIHRLSKWLDEHEADCTPIASSTRLGPPVAKPGKIICVGLNYANHASESGMEIPSEPILFFKASSSLVGPNDPLIIPKGSTKTDWEVELAVVIGKTGRYIAEQEASLHIGGYCLFNDYSEREFQLERQGQWVKGKSCDSFSPLGPYLATPDEMDDVDNLNLWLMVNDTVMQQSNTRNLVFKVPYLVHYISQFMTLEAGDIISTGTPPGVGLGMDPPRYLQEGDQIELGIDGLGSSRQVALAYESLVKG